MTESNLETWELWFPDAAANGLLFARARVDPTDVLWVHAAPPNLAVTVRDRQDQPIAHGEPLIRTGARLPMTRLSRDAGEVRREDRSPTGDDFGSLVLLPGGEVGVLLQWWNAPNETEWRWQIEFYGHR